jgi:uncharacterized protein (TIGR02145 family)
VYTPSIAQQSGNFKDPRGEKVYKTVKIGNKVWFAENLAFVPDYGNYWAYDNNNANIAKYGYLYDWETAIKVCPDGWHLPSDEEWDVLSESLGGIGVAGRKMKSTSGWADNGNGNNSSGFNAKPSGTKLYDGFGYNLGNTVYWWSSTEYDMRRASGRYINDYDGILYKNNEFDKDFGFSVRCIKD